MPDSNGFTGRSRRRKTRASVRAADITARSLITIGGIGTIVAVATVCLFLLAVVLPLFLPAKTELARSSKSTWTDAGAPVHLGIDEYRAIGYACMPDGALNTFDAETGEQLRHIDLLEGIDGEPRAWSVALEDDTIVAGLDDGRIVILNVAFETTFLDEDTVPDSLFEVEPGDSRPFEGGIVQRTIEGQFRLQTLTAKRLGDPAKVVDGPVAAVHHARSTDGLVISALGDNQLIYALAEEVEDMMSGEIGYELGPPTTLPLPPRSGAAPKFVRVAGVGANVVVAWADGHAVRIRTSIPEEAEFVETFTLLDDPTAELTSLEFLLGNSTLITGDSRGRIGGWFMAPAEAGTTGDRFQFLHAKSFEFDEQSAVTTIRSGTRRRMFAAGTERGDVGVFYMTSADVLVREHIPGHEPVTAVSISPKEDGLLAASPRQVVQWEFDPRYPETSVASLFAPVHYEGYAESEHSWQSSSATDDFEPKFGLMPLIFGSIKATVYSLLFGAPLALLAAIYTSEFLDPRWKAWIKPTIEMMASLPSVVLGFLAALVFAPYIERYVPAALASFFLIPFAMLLGAFLWQLLPRPWTTRLGKYRVCFILAMLPVGLLLSNLAAGPMERLLFGSNLSGWLSGLHLSPTVGNALGGWVLLLLPLAALAVALVMTRTLSPVLRRLTNRMERRPAALVSLANFLVGSLLTVGLVVLIGTTLGGLGLDVRKPLPFVGSFMDTFDQRNALVVGFVMGFAIIPLIYTLADDALSTVPEHLRGASLGAGATPWQTAVRIVIPTAMSGLFSALMIGLGRAVGETMIVLMAAGNTPVMSMNMFEGFRTLAANIAVELPEAPVGETHYRTLFLAALTLFAMTFVVNTVAEAVRLRFRKRAYQL